MTTVDYWERLKNGGRYWQRRYASENRRDGRPLRGRKWRAWKLIHKHKIWSTGYPAEKTLLYRYGDRS